MTQREKPNNPASSLRDEAEDKCTRTPDLSSNIAEKTAEEINHELRVHQIELEIQNEELKKAHLDLEASRDKYIDLYDFAPVGYFTLTREAQIEEANLTGASMLGIVRQDLIHDRFRRFVVPQECDEWDHFFLAVLNQGEKHTCELRFKRKDRTEFSARIEGGRVKTINGSFQVRIAMSDVTERKRAEVSLLESEAKFRAIYEGSNDAVMLLNEKGFFDCNPRTLQIFGLKSRDEFVKLHPADLSPPTQPDGRNSLDAANEHIRTALQNGIERFEWVHCRSNGKDFPAEVLLSAINYGKERVLQATVRDITDRKKVEGALKRSERQLADIINFLPDATFVIDRNRTVIAWNKAMEEMTGVPADQMLGKGDYEYAIPFYGYRRPLLADLVFESDEEIEKDYYQVIQKEGNILIAMSNLPRPLGKIVHLWGKATPLYDETGTKIGAIESVRDVTERIKAEQALKESEDKYRTLFENSGSPLMIIDDDTTILLINREFEKNSGYNKNEIEGRRSWTEFIADGNDIEKMMEYHRMRRISTDLAPASYESSIINREGDIRNVIITVTLIPGTRQSLAALVDITDRKRAEKDLIRLTNELEQRVDERTIELRQSQEAYHQANKKLNLLSSITRHDILNQIMVLKGYLTLLNEETDDPELQEYIQKSEHASGIIERHISFTKQYQDIGLYSPKWQNVRECVEKASIDLLPAAVTCVMDLHKVEVYADPLFEKVLYTFVDNSLRHSEHMTGIWLSYQMTDTGELVLTFQDNGVGIRPEDKERIFERGYGKHTGFGLFLAREILSITGLTIQECGAPGKGAIFEITVPVGKFRGGDDESV